MNRPAESYVTRTRGLEEVSVLKVSLSHDAAENDSARLV